MSAGRGLLGRQQIDLPIRGVADAKAHVVVEEREPVRHVLQRRIEDEVLLLQLLFVLQSLGDVLVHGHPAAVGQEAARHLHHPPVEAHHEQGLRVSAADIFQPHLVKFLSCHARQVATRHPVLDDHAVRDAGLQDLGIEVIEAQEALVVDDDAAVGVIHDEAVRHVGERMLAALGLDLQFGLEPRPAGNIVADRHPAAVGKRLQLERITSPLASVCSVRNGWPAASSAIRAA